MLMCTTLFWHEPTMAQGAQDDAYVCSQEIRGGDSQGGTTLLVSDPFSSNPDLPKPGTGGTGPLEGPFLDSARHWFWFNEVDSRIAQQHRSADSFEDESHTWCGPISHSPVAQAFQSGTSTLTTDPGRSGLVPTTVVKTGWILSGTKRVPVPGRGAEGAVVGPRHQQTVHFKNPVDSPQSPGYIGGTFTYAYQFLDCFGELHLAHGLVPNSIRVSKPYYFVLDFARGHIVSVPPPMIEMTPIVVTVGLPGVGHLLVAPDKSFGKAMGFGCFTGQTLKVGLFTDLIGAKPTRQQKLNLMERLSVIVESKESLYSEDGERAARSQEPPSPEAIRQRRQAAEDVIKSLQ